MKRLLFLFFLLSRVACIAQSDTLYFDSEWQSCKKSRATYYSIAEPFEDGYIIKDMFIKTNTPQMVVFSKQIQPPIKEGTCTYYYQNGKIESEGRYSNNKKVGIWVNYSKKGKATYVDYNFEKKLQVTFENEPLSEKQRILDSIYKRENTKSSAWDSSTVGLTKEKKGLAFSVRAKAASFFIIEDVYFVTATLGTEFSYKNHSLGIDGTYFRWRYETDNNDDVGIYSQYELRKYLLADYKYTFLYLDYYDLNIYFNLYDKYGTYSMWYDKYSDYDFGTRDMAFLQSKAKGTFNEPGAGFGVRKHAKESGFGIDCSANYGFRFTNNDEVNYLNSSTIEYRNDVKVQKGLFYMRINCFYNFGR